ncbi:unnamed protein product [Mytilus edulis]|uniref:Uncharacterized protein n=1 Tax=Mytilus edulis TaxID=6550 RepID=A0A8S3UVP9_MYTED|nr:unnamed protein product [Mytilus edulis]
MRNQRIFLSLMLKLLVFISVYYAYYQHFRSSQYKVLESNERLPTITEFRNTSGPFLVDTSACKIPYIDPFDKSLKHMFRKGTALKCAVINDVVYSNGNTIFINWKAVNNSQLKNRMKYCKYEVIWRPYNKKRHHNFFMFKNESKEFVDRTDISNEFIRVKCYTGGGLDVYTNFFSFVHLKADVEDRCEKNAIKFANTRQEQLNVLMMGIDSIARNNMLRYMKETWKYLVNTQNAIDLLGYNKVADNTFPNIVSMTAEKFVNELPRKESLRLVPMDNYNFIWNNYSAKGYRTFYAEDYPDIAIFDCNKAGFNIPPGDYFNRPLSLDKEKNKKSINYALLVIPADKVLRYGKTYKYGDRIKSYIDYQITIQTKPGDAIIEGTLRFDEKRKTYDLVGDVSRINKYGDQSHCIEQNHLKKLCYCKIQP